MLTFTEAQVLAWITPLLWPFLRVLALFGALPLFAQRGVPMRVRVALAFLIAFCAQATLPPMPVVALDSADGFLTIAQQLVIGISLGFAVRIVFSAVEFAGELIGLQMGLNFAGFFNPMTGGEATATSRFFGVSVSWLFIVINGHLLLIRSPSCAWCSRRSGAPRCSGSASGSHCRWSACCSSSTWCSASSRASRSR
jgi:flagellar biosynthesis protein FliR